MIQLRENKSLRVQEAYFILSLLFSIALILFGVFFLCNFVITLNRKTVQKHIKDGIDAIPSASLANVPESINVISTGYRTINLFA